MKTLSLFKKNLSNFFRRSLKNSKRDASFGKPQGLALREINKYKCRHITSSRKKDAYQFIKKFFYFYLFFHFYLFSFFIAFFFILIQVNIITLAFIKLGIPPQYVIFTLLFTLIGSFINIPVAKIPQDIMVEERN